MRIITGKYKGRHFDIPRTFKARPTTDFAKENIFNVLTQYVDFEGATALDLFSGTGSISLELLSRGCQQVVSVELDRDHHRFIQECFRKLQTPSNSPCLGGELGSSPKQGRLGGVFIPIRGDVFRFVKTCKQQFDFIFADPPYALKELGTLPDLIFGTPASADSSTKDRSVALHSSLLTLNSSLLKPSGIFVLEHGKDHDFSGHPHFVEHRQYGSVNFTLFR